ncbi:hypothetical protein HN51_042977, partial [Arachis hypogaea]
MPIHAAAGFHNYHLGFRWKKGLPDGNGELCSRDSIANLCSLTFEACLYFPKPFVEASCRCIGKMPIHTTASSKGGEGSNSSARRCPTSNTRGRSMSRFDLSEAPVTVQLRSQAMSESMRSYAKRTTPPHSNSLPWRSNVHSSQVAAGTEFSCVAVEKKKENECDWVNRIRCSCQNVIRSKRRLQMEGIANDEDHTQERAPSQHDDSTYAPSLDVKFSMDHMPFRSKRSTRAQRNPRSDQDKTQRRKPPNLVDLSGERGQKNRRPQRRHSKSPRCTTSLQRHYNYLAPVGSDRVVHESDLLLMTAEKIPKAFKIAFVPTRSMDLAGVELAVATYIFSKDLSKSEVLADVSHCVADRTALLTLGPNERVMDDVITVVATMLSKTSSSHRWFMPTMIM